MTAQLPALPIVVPLLAAPACLLLRRATPAWLLGTLASLVALVVSALLLDRVMEAGPIHYALGGWPPPWGIGFRIDTANALVMLIVSTISTVVLLFARHGIEGEVAVENAALFYTAYLLCLTGLLGIAITGDAFNLFVFLEISSLSSYTLISLTHDRRGLTSAYQYLVMGTIGATFILIGVGLLYSMTGTLNMADLAERLPTVASTRTVHTAFAFLVVGVGLKLALFPLHLWLPNAYTYAPAVVSAFLSATATKVAVYVLLRFIFTVFGVDIAFGSMPLTEILMVLAVAGILSASTVAIFQENVKRLLAYSSVAQVGYMVLGIAFVTIAGLTATVLHLFNHALMKGALFLALGCVFYRLGSVRLEQMQGIAHRMPWTMAAFVVGGLSLIGVPLTAGFISKWYLVLAALEQGWWVVVAVVVAGSLLAVVYVWRVVETAYFKAPPPRQKAVTEAPLSLLLPTWLLAGANIWFGIDTRLSVEAASQSARLLLGEAP